MMNLWIIFATPKNRIFDPSVASEWQLREALKMSKKSDIVTIRVLTHPTPPISDIKFSDIFFQSPDSPYPMN